MLSAPETGRPFEASPRQWEAGRRWLWEPETRYLLLDGAIRSGKTQMGARLICETAMMVPAQHLVARATYRELEDTVMRAILYGDGGLAPLLPAEALRGGSLASAYRAKDYTVHLANGGEIVFRSLEEHATEKIRGLTLGSFLIDQAEELKYEEGEKIYDEAIGRLSDPRGPKKGMLIANPTGLDHWIFRRFYKEPDRGSAVVHFTLEDNRMNLDGDYFEMMQATRETRPYWYRTFILGEWGALQDAAYDIRETHLVDDFFLEDSFDRYEAADYGLNGAPWCLWATDYEGNLVAVDMIYVKNQLPSELAPYVLQRRAASWGEPWGAYMDPSLWARTGTLNKWGAPQTLADEFSDNGVPLIRANNDPRAGMIQMQERLKIDPDHPFPSWHERRGELGAPRVFFTRHVQALIDELKSAPKQPLDKRDGGEIVDPEWESRNGHAAAMARYAVMVKPTESEEPKPTIEDPRARLHAKLTGDDEEEQRGLLVSPARYMG